MAGRAANEANEANEVPTVRAAGRPLPLVVDVGDLACPDLGTIEALCLVALEVGRCEGRVRLEGASGELLELIDLAGLARVLAPGRGLRRRRTAQGGLDGQLPGVSQTG